MEMSKCCLYSHEGQPKDSGSVALSLVKIGIFGGVRGKLWLGRSQQYPERSLLTADTVRNLKSTLKGDLGVT